MANLKCEEFHYLIITSLFPILGVFRDNIDRTQFLFESKDRLWRLWVVVSCFHVAEVAWGELSLLE